MTYRYLFGPVPSRRLGRSLGVDLMPHKTCSLDCIYCECGKTTHLTLTQKEYVPVDRLLEELSSFLKNDPALDYITFSGSGEPTLHSGIAEIIRFIKDEFPKYKIALLTNGTLFYRKESRVQVAEADLIIVSVDAASEKVFKRMNRPHPRLDFSAVLEGLVALRKEYPGQLWVEVFLVPGVNDRDEDIQALREIIDRIGPDKVQLNTLDRPGTEKWVTPLDGAGMTRVAACIHKSELIPPVNEQDRPERVVDDIARRVLAAIRRRPCTLTDISTIIGCSESDVRRHLAPLLSQKIVEKIEMRRGTFYRAGRERLKTEG